MAEGTFKLLAVVVICRFKSTFAVNLRPIIFVLKNKYENIEGVSQFKHLGETTMHASGL